MLNVFHKKRGVVSKTNQYSSKEFSSQEFIWFDLVNPSSEELVLVSEASKIPLVDLKDYSGSNERPKVYDEDDFSLIVFGAPHEQKRIHHGPHKNFEVETASMSFFITKKKKVVTIRKQEFGAINRVYKKIEVKPNFMNSHVSLIHLILDEMLADFFHFLDTFDLDIDTVENEVFKKAESAHINRIFRIKKSLIYFHKTLIANREVITAIEKGYLAAFSKKETLKFRDLYHDITQLIDSGETLRDILTGIIDIYLSSVSNNLNIVMKRLTVMASYILVPTLISGVYGMNFKFMPELYWKYGYAFALITMIVSILAMRWYFKKESWL
ncbi:magnesium/cobalt transporter CorA [Candidatus Woesearchaeota archaeon]|jgi:magnesium transporter|nr:magnesium/cobalt transporter CorA [Candidatus Woesearchaeota archaeon]